MTFKEQVAAWHLWAESNGIKKGMYHSPIDQSLESLGFEVKPLMFWHPVPYAILLSVYFGSTWGLAMHFIAWKNLALQMQLVAATAAGLMWGTFMSIYAIYYRRKKKIPRWNDLVSKG